MQKFLRCLNWGLLVNGAKFLNIKRVKLTFDFTRFMFTAIFSNYSFPNSPTALISISSLTTADGIPPIPKSVRFTVPVNLKPAIGF